MLFLSGMRASAFATLPIEAVDLNLNSIKQWPELGVETKYDKQDTTYLFPIPELLKIVSEWDDIVRQELQPDSRWYPSIENHWGEKSFSNKPPGKNRSQALSKRLKKLFTKAGLPYKSPHKFRRGHIIYGFHHAKDMTDYKAVSENAMHENIKTTEAYYAKISNEEIGNRISNLASTPADAVRELHNIDIQNLPKDQLSELLIEAGTRLAEM